MTDNTRHTPGEWHVRHCSGTIAVRGKRGVCVVHWHGPKDGEQHRRAIADATLIAAAPDILEALERSIESLAASRHLIGKYIPEHHWLPEHDQRIADARAAILKATGGGK